MIDRLRLRNFKRFASLELSLGGLTVLTGVNGAGKSTAIQSLLLARQVAERPGTEVVELNGPYGLALGEAEDVLHPDAERTDTIDVAVDAEGAPYTYRFGLPRDRALNLEVADRPRRPPNELTGRGLAFTYLTAERLGPRDQLAVTGRGPEDLGIGETGQYTAQVLAAMERETVREPLWHPDTGDGGVRTLRSQVERWCADIVREIRIVAEWPPGLTTSIIRFMEPGLVGSRIRPANIGFGVSYALPIIVAGLSAPEGGVLVVENPEAHLHPAGQSRIGRFLARVAGSGVQVIIETHSDHVLNGIRLSAAAESTTDPADAVVYFFGPGDTGDDPVRIEMTSDGGLTEWPTGFFDQIERDLEGLARVRIRPRDRGA